MSVEDGSRSKPARELAVACGYHVFASGAPAKSRYMLVGPALPSTADPPEQNCGSIFALTWMGTGDLRIPPQYSAAARKTFSRSAPTSVHGFLNPAPTGGGSVRPSPAPAAFTNDTVAADAGGRSALTCCCGLAAGAVA